MVSALPRQEVGPREGALVAFVMNGLFSFLPHLLLERLGVANGQVLAFRKAAYFALGGHEAVRGEVLEDVALARRAGAYGLFLGGGLFRARMYRGYGEAVELRQELPGGSPQKPRPPLGLGLLPPRPLHPAWLFGRWELAYGPSGAPSGAASLGGSLWPGLLAPLAPLLLLPVYLRALLPGKRWKGRKV